jgi:hypothetical protein
MRGPGEHRRRCEISGHVPANIGVDARSRPTYASTVPANIGVDGYSRTLRESQLLPPFTCAWLPGGARRSVPLAVFGASVGGWGATLGGVAGGVWGLGCGLGRDARRCRWRCLGPRLRAGARRSVVSLAPKRTFLEQLGGSETWTCFFRKYLTLLVQLKCANVNSKRKCLIAINPLLKISGALIKSFKSEILIILRHPSVYT